MVLADLHNKKYGKGNQLLLQAIEQEKPDGIWIVGDILTARPKKSLEPALEFLTALLHQTPLEPLHDVNKAKTNQLFL